VGGFAPALPPEAGAAYVVFGPVTGDVDLSAADVRLIGEDAYDQAGLSVASAGDVNGDGFGDLIIGAYGDDDGGDTAGAAYLVLGPVTGNVDLTAADAKFIGEDAEDYAGTSVASAGDVNGDGFDDLIIGAPGDDDGGETAGAAYLVLGPVTGHIDLSAADAKLIGESTADNVGTAIASAGDVDRDGFGDLLIGAYAHDAGGAMAGAAYVVRGPVTGAVRLSAADTKLMGESAGDYAGYSLASAGDVNDDGFDDLVVGALGVGDGGFYAGAAYLVLGPAPGEIDLSAADAKLIGEDASDSAGVSVASAGDVDGDGLPDLLVGAYSDDDGGNYAGAAYVIVSGY
jgi:hypothetical protein